MMAEKTRKLHMIGNAHIDPVWLWRWQEGFHEVKASFRSALDRMNEVADFVFISSSAVFYDWLEHSDPGMFREVQERVAEGRWGIVGGWWIQPDCNIPSGESFVRQALYGQRFFKEKFGVTARVGYNVDSFGHHGMLPQILKKSGLDYYVFMRPSPHEKGLPGRLFWWESDDGSRVLAFRIPFEYCSWGKSLEKHIRRCADETREPLNQLMCFYGVGNHGGGPTRENLETIRQLNQDAELPSLVFSTPGKFFEEAQSSLISFPVVHSDLQHHASGCYSAHSGVKRWNRQAENQLLAAEKFSILASRLTGQPYPEDLERAWKDVLFNQFHDILSGTSLETAYEDARDLYGEASTIASQAQNYALQALAWKLRIPREAGMLPVAVFNPHAWPVKANIEIEIGGGYPQGELLDPAGQTIPFQIVQPAATARGRHRVSFMAYLPPFGYNVYRLVNREGSPQPMEFPTVQATDTHLENARFRLEINPDTGNIRSLFDKQHGLELFQAEAARGVVIDDHADTWGHNTFRYDRVVGEFCGVDVRLVEHGPVKSVLRVTSEFGASRMWQYFSMAPDSDQIDVQVRVDWREQFKMLKLRFPLNLINMRPVYEIPYGHIERFANGDEEPGQSWFDVSGVSRETSDSVGLSILNDGKYSFDVHIRDMGLTVLRSPIYAHHIPAEPEEGQSYSFMDQGLQTFHYSLVPHSGGWESAGIPRRAAELNQPPVALICTYHEDGALPLTGSYVWVDRENVLVSVLKQAEDNQDLIVRAVETQRIPARATIHLRAWEREITADLGPCEIKTFRVPLDTRQPVVETNLLEWAE